MAAPHAVAASGGFHHAAAIFGRLIGRGGSGPPDSIDGYIELMTARLARLARMAVPAAQ